MIVEADIPYRKGTALPLQETAYRWAVTLAGHLRESYNAGYTIIDHWEDQRAGQYLVRFTYSRTTSIEAVPAAGYTRVMYAPNARVTRSILRTTVQNIDRPSMAPIQRDQAIQTEARLSPPPSAVKEAPHVITELPEANKRRSVTSPWLDTVLSPSRSRNKQVQSSQNDSG